MIRRTVFAAAVVVLAAGCRTAAPPQTVPPAVAQPQHLEIDWVRDSAEFRAIFLQTYRLAGERLEEIVAGREPGTWAVALDADETVLSNLRYQEELAAAGEEYSSATWGAWVARREATALPGAAGFLERARNLGGKIAIVTNRKLAGCADTEANLDALGLPYDVVLCRGDDRRKEARWQSLEDGSASEGLPPLDVVMYLGDNIQDFPGLDQSLAGAGEAAFSAFGAELFVVPNPMYGSWAE
jgi:5'-nucleotidase (lipoprotein e(P4) family)